MRLESRVALITGGASGLGRAVARAFVAEGARVVLFDRDASALTDVAAEIGNAEIVSGDVRDPDANQAAVDAAVARFGGVDVLVGNAGIWDYNRPLARMDLDVLDATFDEVMGVNVKGYLLAARAALPALVERRGCMIFTLSNAAFHADGGGALYTASKHAALGVVRQLAFECAPHVRVNGVAPGAIATRLRGPQTLNMAEREIGSLPIDDGLKENLPIDGWAQPEDYAPAFVYLASSQESAFATGSVINVDGGWGARGMGRARGGDGLVEHLSG